MASLVSNKILTKHCYYRLCDNYPNIIIAHNGTVCNRVPWFAQHPTVRADLRHTDVWQSYREESPKKIIAWILRRCTAFLYYTGNYSRKNLWKPFLFIWGTQTYSYELIFHPQRRRFNSMVERPRRGASIQWLNWSAAPIDQWEAQKLISHFTIVQFEGSHVP